jgi:hypothetical protein
MAFYLFLTRDETSHLQHNLVFLIFLVAFGTDCVCGPSSRPSHPRHRRFAVPHILYGGSHVNGLTRCDEHLGESAGRRLGIACHKGCECPIQRTVGA